MSKFREFLQDEKGVYSSTRLIAFGAFLVSSVELFRLDTEGAFGVFVTVWVGNFLGSKAIERFGNDKTI